MAHSNNNPGTVVSNSTELVTHINTFPTNSFSEVAGDLLIKFNTVKPENLEWN